MAIIVGVRLPCQGTEIAGILQGIKAKVEKTTPQNIAIGLPEGLDPLDPGLFQIASLPETVLKPVYIRGREK